MRPELKLLVVVVAFSFSMLSGCDSGDSAPQLGSGHPGWHKADCFACHEESGHRKGHTPGECAECHGDNGAPSGHGGATPCLDCHGTGGLKEAPPEHLGAALSDPDDCMSCH
jgi:hypothetical protein